MSSGRPWTDDQIAILRANCQTASIADLERLTGHSRGSISGKMFRLGLTRGPAELRARPNAAPADPPASPPEPTPATALVPSAPIIGQPNHERPATFADLADRMIAGVREAIVPFVAVAEAMVTAERQRLLGVTQSQHDLIASYQAMLDGQPAPAEPAGLAARLTRAENTITSLEMDKANLAAQLATIEADLAAVAADRDHVLGKWRQIINERDDLASRLERADANLTTMRAERDSYRTAADLLSAERDRLAADLAAARVEARRAVKAGLDTLAIAADKAAPPADQQVTRRLGIMLAAAQRAIGERKAARHLGIEPVDLWTAINDQVAEIMADLDPSLAAMPNGKRDHAPPKDIPGRPAWGRSPFTTVPRDQAEEPEAAGGGADE